MHPQSSIVCNNSILAKFHSESSSVPRDRLSELSHKYQIKLGQLATTWSRKVGGWGCQKIASKSGTSNRVYLSRSNLTFYCFQQSNSLRDSIDLQEICNLKLLNKGSAIAFKAVSQRANFKIHISP